MPDEKIIGTGPAPEPGADMGAQDPEMDDVVQDETEGKQKTARNPMNGMGMMGLPWQMLKGIPFAIRNFLKKPKTIKRLLNLAGIVACGFVPGLGLAFGLYASIGGNAIMKSILRRPRGAKLRADGTWEGFGPIRRALMKLSMALEGGSKERKANIARKEQSERNDRYKKHSEVLGLKEIDEKRDKALADLKGLDLKARNAILWEHNRAYEEKKLDYKLQLEMQRLYWIEGQDHDDAGWKKEWEAYEAKREEIRNNKSLSDADREKALRKHAEALSKKLEEKRGALNLSEVENKKRIEKFPDKLAEIDAKSAEKIANVPMEVYASSRYVSESYWRGAHVDLKDDYKQAVRKHKNQMAAELARAKGKEREDMENIGNEMLADMRVKWENEIGYAKSQLKQAKKNGTFVSADKGLEEQKEKAAAAAKAAETVAEEKVGSEREYEQVDIVSVEKCQNDIRFYDENVKSTFEEINRYSPDEATKEQLTKLQNEMTDIVGRASQWRDTNTPVGEAQMQAVSQAENIHIEAKKILTKLKGAGSDGRSRSGPTQGI